MLNSVGIGKIKKEIDKSRAEDDVDSPRGAAILFWAGNSNFDFADEMSQVTVDGGNANLDPTEAAFPDDGTGGFIKFQDSNKLYNVYDAGNFATGLAYSLIDVPEITVKIGAHANNVVSGRGRDKSLLDSKADQQAIHDGHNYKGVIWKK